MSDSTTLRIYWLEAGLHPKCQHRFVQAQSRADTAPPTGYPGFYTASIPVNTSTRLFCSRCGGLKEWPADSAFYRYEELTEKPA